MVTRETITKHVEHPLEDIFELPSGSTELVITQRHTEVGPCEQFDSKDVEIEEQFQEVYDVAMSTFENAVDLIERSETDPKYVARQMEVAAQFLNTALHAAKEKANLKQGKDRINATTRTAAAIAAGRRGADEAGPVVMDHATLLKLLKGEKAEEPPIEGEFVEEGK